LEIGYIHHAAKGVMKEYVHCRQSSACLIQNGGKPVSRHLLTSMRRTRDEFRMPKEKAALLLGWLRRRADSESLARSKAHGSRKAAAVQAERDRKRVVNS
jgi:hypothetical protein